MTKNVLQMLEKSMTLFPEKPAFSDENGSLTYAEAVLKSKAVGTALGGYACAHRAVAVLMKKSKEMLTAFMGIIYSGNFYVPIDDEMPDDRIAKIFGSVQPVAVIADAQFTERAAGLAKVADEGCRVLSFDEAAAAEPDEALLAKIRDAAIDTDPAYALYTSGSTGMPKGVICCHRSVIDYADWLIDTFAFDENTIFGSQTPFYFSMSVLDIYATIRSGAELHVIPRTLFALPIRLLEHMNEARINSIYWVPTALCIVANMKALDKIEMPYLKKILFAGESMPNKQLNIWRSHLPDALYANLFGPTEITDIGIYYIVDRPMSDDEPVPIGRKCDNVDALILTDNGKPVADGEMGELCIRGSFLSMGYYNNPEKTAEAFIQNPLNTHYPEIIYKTGDLVSINERGEMMYHGRKDFQIKHRGNRIEMGEIENAAASVPGMEMSACIFDAEKDRIVLFYSGREVTTKLIRDHMTQKVPSYMIPNVMIALEELPKNQNGKIDRGRLKVIYGEKKAPKA